MTSSACPSAPSPSRRQIAAGNTPLVFVGLTALPLGLLLDRRFGFLPALTARCGGTETLLGALAWHWTCMPATCLMMLLATPAWIGIEVLARSRRAGSARRDRGTGALAACFCHLAMLVGMASALGAGPELAGAAGLPWTGGAAIAAMAFGMVCGTGAASACGAIKMRQCGPEAEGIGAKARRSSPCQGQNPASLTGCANRTARADSTPAVRCVQMPAVRR
jgi:hypothetical protein